MRRTLLLMVLLGLWGASAGFAEGVWVEEDWHRVRERVDCGGVLLVVDARVLGVAENATAREYHMDRLSKDFMVSKGQGMDWLQLGCDTSNGSWRKPTNAWPEYAYTTRDVIYPACSIGALCSLTVQNINPRYIYETHHDLMTDTVDQIGIEGLTEERFMAYAEAVASACDYQLGKILRIHRVDQSDMIRKSIEAVSGEAIYGNPDPEKAEEYTFVDAYFPVYVSGLRLYSGDYTSTVDQMEVPNMNLRLAATAGHGIALIDSALLDPAALQATGEARPVLSEQEAIRCMEERYVGEAPPGLRQVTVHQLALEYVPMAGDVSASEGFSLYPAWVARVTWETDTRETITTYEAYHAVTGERLF